MSGNSLVRAVFRAPKVFLMALIASSLPALAQGADETAKQADQQLRQAERSMFGGKLDEAQKQFDQARELVTKLASAAPDHKALKGLQGKCEKLQRDLARRLPPGDAAKPEAKPPARTAGDKLPGGVSKRLRDVDAQLVRLAGYLESSSVASPESRVKTAQGYVDDARATLAEIDKTYGKDVPSDHPALAAARTRVVAAEADIEAFHQRLVQAASAPKPEAPASADRDTVEKLYASFRVPLDAIHGKNLVYGLSVEDAQKGLDMILTIERDVLPTLQPALAALSSKYGTESTAIDDKLQAMGVPPGDRFSNELDELIRGVQHVGSSRTASADYLAQNVLAMCDTVDRLVPDVRVKRLQEQKARLLIAQQFDPGNSTVNEQLAAIDGRIEATVAKVDADIDAAVWAGHVDGFPGPGKVEELAAAAKDFFTVDSRWGGNDKQPVEVLAVAVRGPWRVAQRDVFGRVTSWRLPIHLAITRPDLRARGIARVYELSAVAMEGSPDKALQAPPFDGYWVGNSWMMRLSGL